MKGWLKLFRVVNLPTVPGDVLAGASVVWAVAEVGWVRLLIAALASVAAYLFGLADNDVVGAKTDGAERPIPAGEVTLAAARLARGICLGLVPILGAAANLRPEWWIAMGLLIVSIVVYNRTKNCVLMGLCRGFNFLCGAVAAVPVLGGGRLSVRDACLVGGLFLLWTGFIAAVTKFSEGEEMDDRRRKAVGVLIGSLIYLQLLVMLVFPVKAFLVVGAFLLLVLRLSKRYLPEVSAS